MIHTQRHPGPPASRWVMPDLPWKVRRPPGPWASHIPKPFPSQACAGARGDRTTRHKLRVALMPHLTSVAHAWPEVMAADSPSAALCSVQGAARSAPAPWPELGHTVTTEHALICKEFSRETGHQRQGLAPTSCSLQQQVAQGRGGKCVGVHGWRPGVQGSQSHLWPCSPGRKKLC